LHPGNKHLIVTVLGSCGLLFKGSKTLETNLYLNKFGWFSIGSNSKSKEFCFKLREIDEDWDIFIYY